MKNAQRRLAALDPSYGSYHYLRDEVAHCVVDRLNDINRSFNTTVEIGCGTGAHISKLIMTRLIGEKAIIPTPIAATDNSNTSSSSSSPPIPPPSSATTSTPSSTAPTSSLSSAPPLPLPPPTISSPSRGIIEHLHLCDSSPEYLQRTREYWSSHLPPLPTGRSINYHLINDEDKLPFETESVDLILSSLHLHWVNDLPQMLKEFRRILKPDGVILLSMLGGATLQELRSAFTVADTERLGGVHAHVSPFVYGRDCGDLIASAGFTMPTGKNETIVRLVWLLIVIYYFYFCYFQIII
jgi:hypothetical protein